MKKLLPAFALLCCMTFNSNAQIESGTILAGGGLTFNHYINKQTDQSSTSFVISPQFGFAIAEDFVLGAWFSFQTVSDFNSWSVAPFVRYYMSNFFVQAGYGYNQSGEVGRSVIDAELGYAIFLNDNIALEPALYYNQYFNNGLNGADLGAKIGFQLYFNR